MELECHVMSGYHGRDIIGACLGRCGCQGPSEATRDTIYLGNGLDWHAAKLKSNSRTPNAS